MVTRMFAGLMPVALVLLGALAAPAALAAPVPLSVPGIGTMDNVPAATLLIPYFEVDLDNTNGRNTVISLSDTSASALLANVTIWSNAGVAVKNFNIYLTGFDVSNIDLRAVLNGTLPVSATDGQDPTDTISNQGVFSQDINYASCTGTLPYAALGAGEVADIQAMLTGRASTVRFPGQCVGTNAGDNVARGYVTIDTVNQCGTTNPSSGNYFGNSVATNQNIMLADYMLVDPSQGTMSLEAAVAIEASTVDPETSFAGQYTFYGRHVGWNASDNREPLATIWVVQGDYGSSNAIIWRDPKTTSAAFTCGGAPNYAPMGHERVSYFDQAGEITVATATSVAPVSTQMTAINSATMGIPVQKMGWMYMNLNSTVAPAGANPPEDPAASQSHITVLRTHKGVTGLRSGAVATPLDSATDASHLIIGR